MGSRERKRAERRKRRRRAAERGPADSVAPGEGQGAADAAAASPDGARSPAGERDPYAEAASGEESFAQRMARRSEQRNAEARAKLEPLPEGERPGAVTVGAVVSAVFALVFTASAVFAGVTDTEVRGEEPHPVPLAVFGAALWLMVYGLWKARYWAVLGLQMLLVLVLVSVSLGLVAVSTIPQLLVSLLLIAGSGALFYKLIRAMARIQMPQRPGSR